MPNVLSGSQYIDELKKRALIAEQLNIKTSTKRKIKKANHTSQSLLLLRRAMNYHQYINNMPPRQYQALYPQTISQYWNQNKNYRRR